MALREVINPRIERRDLNRSACTSTPDPWIDFTEDVTGGSFDCM